MKPRVSLPRRRRRTRAKKQSWNFIKWTKVFSLVTILALSVTVFLSFLKAQKPPLGCFCDIDKETFTEEYDPTATVGEFENKLVSVPPLEDSLAQILGLGVSNVAKRIEVDLKRQRVYALEGNSVVFNFLVSTGKWYPTPRGAFSIERKVRAQKMSGGSRVNGSYYYLPNVPWVMFYGNRQIPWWRGFSFHGTYWHNNFGFPMSHGCVNMKIPDAELLYKWAPIGTLVLVY